MWTVSFLLRSEGLDHAEGRPHASWLRQVESYLKDTWHGGPGVCLGDGQTEAYVKNMGMTGLASAWAKARRRPF